MVDNSYTYSVIVGEVGEAGEAPSIHEALNKAQSLAEELLREEIEDGLDTEDVQWDQQGFSLIRIDVRPNSNGG